MAAPSRTPNPITGSNLWTYAVINGVPTPGVIARGGIKGFARLTGWDKKAGKGTQGATLTLKTMPPCEGSITLQLFRALTAAGVAQGTGAAYPGVDDFGNWDSFVEQVLALGPKEQQAQGLTIFHPQFASIGLTKVVVESYTGPEYQGKGMYHATIKLIEWQQPPPVSIVKTVAGTAPPLPQPGQNLIPDSPRNTALKAQIARLQQGGT